ncbi:FAD/NAD(P)-binding domain-containing protein [Lophium mytilinum]|uniref:FAD/NAD(P)-binding domain-containing protein n=1 Tax=Lophium mytilinum TaxID=390894 RepID=A0A6A6QWD8_9PEZI|nr:FAD/NAD(P)-binding domain-containing protein [Lophium mytilinum]
MYGPAPAINGPKRSQQAIARHSQPSLTISYPSQSLRFLQNLKDRVTSPQESLSSSHPTPARLRLNIVIVGAGLGGLSLAIALARRGHSVGAGIQIPPNSGRLLHRWGVFEYLEKLAVKPEGINFRRWENGQTIGYTALGKSFQEDFEVPYYVVHRAHVHEALHQRALDLGVLVELESRVVQYHEEHSTIVLENGSVIQGDLVVAADGIKSRARKAIHPNLCQDPQFNGFAAYRATVDVQKMQKDPEIAWILEKPSLNLRRIGEDRHVMTYTIAGGDSFNMVLSHIDHSEPATWTERFAKEHIQKEFSGWDPQLTKIISLIDESVKWPLKVGKQLNSWTSPSAKLVILGDAAHAMLPYMSQGAAMAVEDSAALAVVLNCISTLEELPFAMRAFEKERIKRSSDMQNASTVNGLIWHFADGPEQRARDASMAAEVVGSPFTKSANQWSDPVTQWWAYGHDAEKRMEEAWNEAVRDLIIRAG